MQRRSKQYRLPLCSAPDSRSHQHADDRRKQFRRCAIGFGQNLKAGDLWCQCRKKSQCVPSQSRRPIHDRTDDDRDRLRGATAGHQVDLFGGRELRCGNEFGVAVKCNSIGRQRLFCAFVPLPGPSTGTIPADGRPRSSAAVDRWSATGTICPLPLFVIGRTLLMVFSFLSPGPALLTTVAGLWRLLGIKNIHALLMFFAAAGVAMVPAAAIAAVGETVRARPARSANVVGRRCESPRLQP